MTTETAPESVRPSVAVTLLVLAGTVVFMSVFLGLYKVLGVGTPYMGVLFLLYWGAMLHMRFATYLASVVGALVGTALAWMLIVLPETMGVPGSVVAYSALGVILFCYTRLQGGIFANNGTLLFVLVSTIPELQVKRNIDQMLLSVVLSAAFIGAVAWLINRLQDWRDKRTAAQGS